MQVIRYCTTDITTMLIRTEVSQRKNGTIDRQMMSTTRYSVVPFEDLYDDPGVLRLPATFASLLLYYSFQPSD